MQVEYLLVLDGKDNFCSNNLTFNNFLMTNSDLSLIGNYIEYKDLKVEYKAQFEEMEENKRSIHVYFSCTQKNEEINIEQYEQFLRVVKNIFYKLSKNIHTLRNDISFYYSELAYPKIHQVENLMRKLITKFMITNVGLSWTEKHIPKEVREARGNSKENSNVDYLYNLDFIQLSNILFKEYSPFTPNELFEKIKKANEDSEVPLTYLKKFVPSSNWERYFSEIVDSEADYLKKRWTELYYFRNQVAHNNILTKKDFQEIDRYVIEIKEKLDKAIQNVDQIKVTDEEKEIISSNIILEDGSNLDTDVLVRTIIKSHWKIDDLLLKIIIENKKKPVSSNEKEELLVSTLIRKVEWLSINEIFSEAELISDLQYFNKIREGLILNSNENTDAQSLNNAVSISRRLIEYLEIFIG